MMQVAVVTAVTALIAAKPKKRSHTKCTLFWILLRWRYGRLTKYFWSGPHWNWGNSAELRNQHFDKQPRICSFKHLTLQCIAPCITSLKPWSKNMEGVSQKFTDFQMFQHLSDWWNFKLRQISALRRGMQMCDLWERLWVISESIICEGLSASSHFFQLNCFNQRCSQEFLKLGSFSFPPIQAENEIQVTPSRLGSQT